MFRDKRRDTDWTVEKLQYFESEVCRLYEQGLIRGPVHLSKGNEDYLIELFQYIHPTDWVFSTWRNHYHSLLHGVPEDELMRKILQGRSISFQSPEHHVYTSAIVNGILPIAVGTALGIKWGNQQLIENSKTMPPYQGISAEDETRSMLEYAGQMVWCFIGDMASESGAFYEAIKYSARNELPIHFVIEDNGLSTNTPTQEAWGMIRPEAIALGLHQDFGEKYVSKFTYKRDTYPHVGVGKWIHF